MESAAKRSLLGFVALALLGTGVARSQTNAEVNAGIQFNFSTPGARSLSLGGAFVGLADDATAAYTNPAGLTVLSKAEVSLEGRSWDATSRYANRGHGFGDPSGIGVDTIAGIQLGENSEETAGISFLSYVYPRERWAFAVYRHEFANFEASFQTEGPFSGAFAARVSPLSADIDLEIVTLGISGAYRVNEKLSLGLGVSLYDFELDSRSLRHSHANYTGPADPNIVTNIQTQQGSDDDIGFNLGLLWAISDQWSLGAVYRKGGLFDFRVRNEAGPDNCCQQPGHVWADQAAEFNVPDVWGLGLSFQPTDAFTISFDVNLVEYSDMTDNMINVFNLSELSRFPVVDRLEIDDGVEARLGLEYVLLKLKYPVALRAGVWEDPDHRLAYHGVPPGGTEDINHRRAAISFQAGDDEMHYAFGFGVAFGAKFQLDVGLDFSELIDTASLSGVYRF